MSTAIEIVIFKPVAGTTQAQLTEAALAITPAIEQLPGYVSREFGASGDGQYVDIVHWRDMAAAQAAAEQVMEIPQCMAFFRLIDEDSVQMLHFNRLG